MSDVDLSRVGDGGALRITASGMVILRRRKHEWVTALESARPDRFKALTGKISGSKFLPEWGLNRLVDWIEEQLALAGWSAEPPVDRILDIRLHQAVGFSHGREVHTIRTDGAGRYVHAYPIED